MKRPRLLRLLTLFGQLLCCLPCLAFAAGCEPVPANTVISCKADMDCPNMLRCSGNICRRKAVMAPAAGAGGSAGIRAAGGAGSGTAAKPAGPMAGTTAAMMSGQSTMPPQPGASALPGAGASAMMSSSGTSGSVVVVMCPPDACTPGGTCMQGATDYSCICNAGFAPSAGAKRCLPNIYCPARACVPGGKCVEGMSDFSCMCDPGYEGTGTKDCKLSAGGTPAAAGGACPAEACSPGGQCVPAMGDYSCKCSVELKKPDPKNCPLIAQQDGSVFDVKRNLTWQKAIGSTPKGALSPLDDATTAMRYCAAVVPASTWRAPTADELRSLPALASDRHACFGTTTGVVCNEVPVDSGQTTPANMIDMRCVH